MKQKALHQTRWSLIFAGILSLLLVAVFVTTAFADDQTDAAASDPDATLEEVFSSDMDESLLKEFLEEAGKQSGGPVAGLTSTPDESALKAMDDGEAPVGRLKILARYNDDMSFYDGHVYLLFTSYQDGVAFTVKDLYGAYDISDQYYADIAKDISCGSNHTGSDAERYFTFSDSLKTTTLNRGEIVTLGMYRDFDLTVPQAALGSIKNSTLWSQLSKSAKTAVVQALLKLFMEDSISASDAVDDIKNVVSEYGSDINYLLDGVVDGGVCFNRELYNQKLEWDQYENVTYEIDITQAQLDNLALYLTGNYNKFSILKNSCATVALRAWNAIVGEEDQLVMDASGIYRYIDAPKSVRDAIRNTFEGREDYHWNSSEGGELADPEAGYTDETGWVYVSAPEPVEPLTFTYQDESLQIDANKSKMAELLTIARQGQAVTYDKNHQEVAVSLDTDTQGDVTTVQGISFDINGTVFSLDENAELPEGIWLKAKLADSQSGAYVTDADGKTLRSATEDGWISFQVDALPASYQIVTDAEGVRNLLTTTIVNGDKAQATTQVYYLVDGEKKELGAKEDVLSGTKIYVSSKMSPDEFDYMLTGISFNGSSILDEEHYDAEQDAYAVVMPETYSKLTITYDTAVVYGNDARWIQVSVGDTLDISDYAKMAVGDDFEECDLIGWRTILDPDGNLSYEGDSHRVLKAQKPGQAIYWAGANGNDNIGIIYFVEVHEDINDLAAITYPEYDAIVLVHDEDGTWEVPNPGFRVEKGTKISVETIQDEPMVVSSLKSNGTKVGPGETIVVNEDTEIEVSFKEAKIKGMPERVELAATGDTFQLDAEVRYDGLINQFLSVYDPSITYVASNDLISVDETGLITVTGEIPEGGRIVTVTAYAGSSNKTVSAQTKVVLGDYDGDEIVGRLTIYSRRSSSDEMIPHSSVCFTTYKDIDLDVSYHRYYEPTEQYKALMEDYRDNPDNYDSDPALCNGNELGLEDRESYFILHNNGSQSDPETISLRCGESMTVSCYSTDPSNAYTFMGALLYGDMGDSESVQELFKQLALGALGSDYFDGEKAFDSLVATAAEMAIGAWATGENPANGHTMGGVTVNRELFNIFRNDNNSQSPNSFYTVEITADELARFESYLADPNNNYYSLFTMNCGSCAAHIWNETLSDRSELQVSPDYTSLAEESDSLYVELVRLRLKTGKTYDPDVEHSEGGGFDYYPRSVACPNAGPVGSGQWERLSGSGRYDTMAAIVGKGFPRSRTAVLASGSNFPDALVASSVAGALKCPVVLTEPKALAEQAQAQLERLGVNKVVILGGKGAVSDDVVATLEGMGISSERISGSSRQATSLAALQAVADMEKFNGTVVVATGANFADALSIGPWCYRTATPILLVNDKGELTDEQVALAKSLDVKDAVIVGGSAAVSDAVATQLGVSATRLKGANRYETSKAIAEWELEQGMTMANVTVATGKNFPDALAGAALCGKKNSVILLAQDKDAAGLTLVSNEVGVKTGYVLGGTGAVSEELFSYLEGLTA